MSVDIKILAWIWQELAFPVTQLCAVYDISMGRDKSYAVRTTSTWRQESGPMALPSSLQDTSIIVPILPLFSIYLLERLNGRCLSKRERRNGNFLSFLRKWRATKRINKTYISSLHHCLHSILIGLFSEIIVYILNSIEIYQLFRRLLMVDETSPPLFSSHTKSLWTFPKIWAPLPL